MALLVHLILDQAVWVLAQAGEIMLCSWARHSLNASFHPGVQMGLANLMLGVTLR